MARKRMIDPNFWIDEKLGECSITERLLFMGLISNADDEGYGRANSKLVKAMIFPYDDFTSDEIENWLLKLNSSKIITLFVYNGQTYYYLPNFLNYQVINRPTKSSLPHFDTEGVELIEEEQKEATHTQLTEHSVNTHTQFSEGSVNTHTQLSGNIIEKNIKEIKLKEDNRIKEKDKEKKIAEIYNSLCPNLPQVQKITEKRSKAIQNFLKEFTVEQFEQICSIANLSDFLTGNNNRGWKADFDFLMRPDKATNVLEGKYGKNAKSNSFDDFKELWEEAKIKDEQSRNNPSNNASSG